MPQERVVSLRRQLSSRRSFKYSDGMDDRGWTLLHVGARKGNLKELVELGNIGFDLRGFVVPFQALCLRNTHSLLEKKKRKKNVALQKNRIYLCNVSENIKMAVRSEASTAQPNSHFNFSRRLIKKRVKRLLDEGMDVNVSAWGPKSQGVTPLHLAAEGGHLKVMDKLLERGADIDARTKGACGWTPLHTAAKARNKEAIKFLIENGAFLPDDMNDGRWVPNYNDDLRARQLVGHRS
ncbi:hypothetical protein ACLOJK_041791 [Asimina triloba]